MGFDKIFNGKSTFKFVDNPRQILMKEVILIEEVIKINEVIFLGG